MTTVNKLTSLLKRKNGAMDLTTGSPIKRILVFMIPMLIGNVFQQLYSMVDTIIVGQALGANALAGVSFTGAISFLILGFVGGLTHGFSVVVSQRRGAHDEDGMRTSFATGIVLTVGIVAVMTIIALLIAKPMLVAMKTNPTFLPYSLEYIAPIFGGMIFTALYNQFAATLRAIGDSVVPLYFLIFASFLNVGMDCLTVLVFDMGVRVRGDSDRRGKRHFGAFDFYLYLGQIPCTQVRQAAFRAEHKAVHRTHTVRLAHGASNVDRIDRNNIRPDRAQHHGYNSAKSVRRRDKNRQFGNLDAQQCGHGNGDLRRAKLRRKTLRPNKVGRV